MLQSGFQMNVSFSNSSDEVVCPENPLIELTETVHMVLFMVMMIFRSAVLLVKIGKGNKIGIFRHYFVTPMNEIKKNT